MRLPLLLAPALFLVAGHTAAADAGCTARDAEVQALKARVLELEDQLAGRKAQLQVPAATATGSLQVQATGATPDLPQATAQSPNKVTRTVVVVEEEAHSRTGCSLGLFKGLPPGKWKEPGAWDELQTGMSAVEVELALGVEHYNVGGGNRVIWQYGKCGKLVRGEVLLVNGRVEQWRRPEF